MNNNTEKIREKEKREYWRENKSDVDENGVGKKGRSD